MPFYNQGNWGLICLVTYLGNGKAYVSVLAASLFSPDIMPAYLHPFVATTLAKYIKTIIILKL